MANRPVFVVEEKDDNFIKEVNVDFTWFPGMAPSQKIKSMKSLHENAIKLGYKPILEISSKSEVELGYKLSAFNLKMMVDNFTKTSVESVYQGSKVFEHGGPYTDIFNKNSHEAKKDERLFSSGKLVKFQYQHEDWDLQPVTSFYDWIYIQALTQNEELANDVIKYSAFTDIEYNPKKQVSCQARSVAYYVSLVKRNLLNDFLKTKKDFLMIYKNSNLNGEQYKISF